MVFSCSISVKRAWSLKECPGSKKCLSKAPPFGLLTSYLWEFMRRWAGGSLFPTYCLDGHRAQCPRYSTFLLRQLRSCLISNSSPVTSLLNVFVDCRWRQHWLFPWVRQALEPGKRGFRFSLTIFFPLERCIFPRMSRRFLFRLNATTGFSVNVSARLP